MPTTEIIQFGVDPATVDATIQKAIQALEGVNHPQAFVLGTQIQDKGAIQITSECDDVQDYTQYASIDTAVEQSSFLGKVRSACGEPQSTFHVALNPSAFLPGGPAMANVVEYAQSYFPASRVTPEFQKRIEDDFSRFDELFSKGATGWTGLATGWVLEEQEHADLKGEKAKCFLIARGWESMNDFEQSIKQDAYEEAVQILFAWSVPFKMVSVCCATIFDPYRLTDVVACRAQVTEGLEVVMCTVAYHRAETVVCSHTMIGLISGSGSEQP